MSSLRSLSASLWPLPSRVSSWILGNRDCGQVQHCQHWHALAVTWVVCIDCIYWYITWYNCTPCMHGAWHSTLSTVWAYPPPFPKGCPSWGAPLQCSIQHKYYIVKPCAMETFLNCVYFDRKMMDAERYGVWWHSLERCIRIRIEILGARGGARLGGRDGFQELL